MGFLALHAFSAERSARWALGVVALRHQEGALCAADDSAGRMSVTWPSKRTTQSNSWAASPWDDFAQIHLLFDLSGHGFAGDPVLLIEEQTVDLPRPPRVLAQASSTTTRTIITLGLAERVAALSASARDRC